LHGSRLIAARSLFVVVNRTARRLALAPYTTLFRSRKSPVHSSRDRPDGRPSVGAGRVRWRPPHGLRGRPGAGTRTAAREPPGSRPWGRYAMHHAVRPRTLPRPGPVPAPRPRPARVRSVIDADAPRRPHRGP